jgi:K+-sensing histidine kinase KdpD
MKLAKLREIAMAATAEHVETKYDPRPQTIYKYLSEEM